LTHFTSFVYNSTKTSLEKQFASIV